MGRNGADSAGLNTRTLLWRVLARRMEEDFHFKHWKVTIPRFPLKEWQNGGTGFFRSPEPRRDAGLGASVGR